jgi:hypothetical protein
MLELIAVVFTNFTKMPQNKLWYSDREVNLSSSKLQRSSKYDYSSS